MRIVSSSAQSIIIELERNSSVLPCFVLALTAVVPWVPLMMIFDSNVHIIAWELRPTESGHASLLRRHKSACSETGTTESSLITLALVESMEEIDNRNNLRILKKRIALCTDSDLPFYSPWKTETTNNLEVVADRINSFIHRE